MSNPTQPNIKDKTREEFFKIVKLNWHQGAGEIIDTDKFFNEILDFISKTLKRDRDELLEKIKEEIEKDEYWDRTTEGVLQFKDGRFTTYLKTISQEE